MVLLFQVAWPTVQITHLAMIPELCKTAKDRADLTAMRYSASVTSSVIVFIVTWLVLQNRTTDSKNIGPGDADRFRVSYNKHKLHETFLLNPKFPIGRVADLNINR